MTPPPADQLATRIFLGPALRAQPDRRLVTLVREGYEAAFEEIVRRYRSPLDRFAAGFVGSRSEDVTQDAFSKALLALRGSEAEIELRPWLYRIVRNTALNDLRDSPPSGEQLAEGLPGGLNAAEAAERREEMTELMDRLRALPEPQRAAIVMRELEGLSHEEIAAALGLSGGGARQAIYRARQALRDGAALLLPLPLVRFLVDHGGDAATAGGAVVAASGASGAGAGSVALKAGVAAAVLAGSVGTGVALHDQDGGRTADASPLPARVSSAEPGDPAPAAALTTASSDDSSGEGSGDDHGGRGHGSGDRGDDDPRKTEHRGHGARSGGERHGRHRERGHGGGGHQRQGRPPDEREHGGDGHRSPRPERHGDRSGPGGGHRDRSGSGGGDRLGESDSSGPGPNGDETASRSRPGDGSSQPPPPEDDRSGSGDGEDSGGSGGDSGESGGNSGPDGDDETRDLQP